MNIQTLTESVTAKREQESRYEDLKEKYDSAKQKYGFSDDEFSEVCVVESTSPQANAAISDKSALLIGKLPRVWHVSRRIFSVRLVLSSGITSSSSAILFRINPITGSLCLYGS